MTKMRTQMPRFATPLGNLARNIRRLVALAWQDQKLLVLGLGGLSVAASGIAFLRAGAMALLINALASPAGAARSGLAMAVVLAVLASVAPDLICSVLEYLQRQFHISLEEKIELLLLRRKGEIDLATHEDPKFNDLLNRGIARDLPAGRSSPLAVFQRAEYH